MKQSLELGTLHMVEGPVDSNLIAQAQVLLRELARAPSTEPWLRELQGDALVSRELYRDPKHGFLLLGWD